eukprot:SAG11_NODE_2948_length_2818_cov_1.988599_2_plen_113_part_00
MLGAGIYLARLCSTVNRRETAWGKDVAMPALKLSTDAGLRRVLVSRVQHGSRLQRQNFRKRSGKLARLHALTLRLVLHPGYRRYGSNASRIPTHYAAEGDDRTDRIEFPHAA